MLLSRRAFSSPLSFLCVGEFSARRRRPFVPASFELSVVVRLFRRYFSSPSSFVCLGKLSARRRRARCGRGLCVTSRQPLPPPVTRSRPLGGIVSTELPRGAAEPPKGSAGPLSDGAARGRPSRARGRRSRLARSGSDRMLDGTLAAILNHASTVWNLLHTCEAGLNHLKPASGIN